MNVGDLVRFKNNGMLGLVVGVVLDYLGGTMYAISWMAGHPGTREAEDLEVVNANGALVKT